MTFCFRDKNEAEQVAKHFGIEAKPTERIDFQNGGRFMTYDVELPTKGYQEIEGTRRGSFSQGGGSANFQAGPFVIYDKWWVSNNKREARLIQVSEKARELT